VRNSSGCGEEGVIGDDHLAALDVERAEDDFDGARTAADCDGEAAATTSCERFLKRLAVLAERELAAPQAGFDETLSFLDVVVAEDDGSGWNSHGHLWN
jgi:hypothetical protein